MTARAADGAAGGNAAAQQRHKRSRTGFHAALPTSDDAWRRKLEKAKEAKVRRAKTLQTYAKVKARALAADGATEAEGHKDQAPETMHPDRQARLDDDGNGAADDNNDEIRATRQERPDRPRRNPKQKQPPPFQKAREEAEQRKAEAEARRAEFERRMADRDAKRAERARQQKAMAKARRVDAHASGRGHGNGEGSQRRKLGREGGVLLDRVRKLMGK